MGFLSNIGKQITGAARNFSFDDIGSRLEQSITDPLGFTKQVMAENPVGLLGTLTAAGAIETPSQQAPQGGAGLTPEQARNIEIEQAAGQQGTGLAATQAGGQFGGQFGGRFGSANRFSGLQAQQAGERQRFNQFQASNDLRNF